MRTSAPGSPGRPGRSRDRVPGADQAFRRADRGGRHRPRRAPGARCTASSGRTARARRRRSGCCSASSDRPPARAAFWANAIPTRAAKPCCPASGPSSRVRPSIPTCPAGPTCCGSTRPTSRPTRGPPGSRIDAALDRVGLLAAATKKLPRLLPGHAPAAGHRRRAARPRELLVLDEPTNGLDPQGTREVRHLIASLAVGRHDRLRLEPPAVRGGADVHPSRRHARGPARRPGLRPPRCAAGRLRRRGSSRTAQPSRPGSCRSSASAASRRCRRGPRGAGRHRTGEDRRSARRGRRRRQRVRRDAARSRGPVRPAHRGGLRCQRLSRSHRRPARPARRRAPWRSSTRLLRSELRLIGGRRRNQMGLLVLAAVPVVLAISVGSRRHARGGGRTSSPPSRRTGCSCRSRRSASRSGFFLPLAIAMLARRLDRGRGERRDPALPADRAGGPDPAARHRSTSPSCIGALWGVAVVAVAGAVVGIALFGAGPMLTLSGTEIGVRRGGLAGRCSSALPQRGTGRPRRRRAVRLDADRAAAWPRPIAVMIVTILSWIARLDSPAGVAAPVAARAPVDVVRRPAARPALLGQRRSEGCGSTLAYAVVFWLAAWARFAGKDITS